jgi:hypothetical protein
MSFISKIKPAPWAIASGLVAPEWRWFWEKKHKSILLFQPPIPNDNERVWDYSAKIFRDLNDSTGGSKEEITEVGSCWKSNHESSGSERGLRLADTGFLFGEPHATIVAYLKLHNENRDNTNEHTIYAEWDANGALLFWYDPAANRLEGFIFTGTTASVNFSAASDIDDGEFHTVALRYDGAIINGFTDGVKDANSTSKTGTLGGATGGVADWARRDNSSADAGQYLWAWAACFADVLSDAQILSLARDPFGPFRMADEARIVYDLAAVAAVGIPSLVTARHISVQG